MAVPITPLSGSLMLPAKTAVRSWSNVKARAGTVLEDGLREAIILSIMEMVCVNYMHNMKTFEINPKKIVDSISSEEII